MNAIIFDFDGVLLESEYESNRHLAELLTELGHPTGVEDALTHYSGLSGRDFIAAIEARIGARLTPEFHERRGVEDARALRDGLAAVAGAVEFVRSLPPDLPRAVASSSSVQWIGTHLDHLGLRDSFGDHLYSGAEHVRRGKPAPDLYLHAARQLGVPIAGCTIIEDSPVGARGALASGGRVVGLIAGSHCLTGHDERLQAIGIEEIADSFADVRRLLGLG
ncbi:HAD family phosphatase [Sphingomonas sp.]|uniref:HAD family hydrolase n=1 Tax=Sphingomonas sp. TaxID=28214 RepID=UPI003450EDFC